MTTPTRAWVVEVPLVGPPQAHEERDLAERLRGTNWIGHIVDRGDLYWFSAYVETTTQRRQPPFDLSRYPDAIVAPASREQRQARSSFGHDRQLRLIGPIGPLAYEE